MAFYELKKKSILNTAGLYTQEQIDELEEKIAELWLQLNSAYACLLVHPETIKHMTNKDSLLSEEMRMNFICKKCDELTMEANECIKVLNKDWTD